MLHKVNKRRRKGYVNTLELLFVVPFLLVLALAMVYFSSMMAVQTLLSNAARQANRKLTTGGTEEDARAIIQQTLGKQRARHVRLSIEPPLDRANPPLPGQPLEVVVKIKTKKAIPNLLAFIGLDSGNKDLVGRSVMCVE